MHFIPTLANQSALANICCLWYKLFCVVNNLERWPSGLRRTPGERVVGKTHPWVQIPPSPPKYRDRRPGFSVEVILVKKITDKLRPVVIDILSQLGLELFDITLRRERRKLVLRVVIDDPENYVSIRQCEIVSSQIGNYLDEADLIDSSYILEVSSPGLDRPLREIKDYNRFVGRLAKIWLKDGKVLVGNIKETTENTVSIELKNGEIITFSFDQIKKGKLEIDF
ncbi:MAG: ribosome maturation factor RimP [Pseudothermotoga sp.]|nr:ribosome maturation factor RimP [Pseudothermotoga sp.]